MESVHDSTRCGISPELEAMVLCDMEFKLGVCLQPSTDVCKNTLCPSLGASLKIEHKPSHPFFYSTRLIFPTQGTSLSRSCRDCRTRLYFFRGPFCLFANKTVENRYWASYSKSSKGETTVLTGPVPQPYETVIYFVNGIYCDL